MVLRRWRAVIVDDHDERPTSFALDVLALLLPSQLFGARDVEDAGEAGKVEEYEVLIVACTRAVVGGASCQVVASCVPVCANFAEYCAPVTDSEDGRDQSWYTEDDG